MKPWLRDWCESEAHSSHFQNCDLAPKPLVVHHPNVTCFSCSLSVHPSIVSYRCIIGTLWICSGNDLDSLWIHFELQTLWIRLVTRFGFRVRGTACHFVLEDYKFLAKWSKLLHYRFPHPPSIAMNLKCSVCLDNFSSALLEWGHLSCGQYCIFNISISTQCRPVTFRPCVLHGVHQCHAARRVWMPNVMSQPAHNMWWRRETSSYLNRPKQLSQCWIFGRTVGFHEYIIMMSC